MRIHQAYYTERVNPKSQAHRTLATAEGARCPPTLARKVFMNTPPPAETRRRSGHFPSTHVHGAGRGKCITSNTTACMHQAYGERDIRHFKRFSTPDFSNRVKQARDVAPGLVSTCRKKHVHFEGYCFSHQPQKYAIFHRVQSMSTAWSFFEPTILVVIQARARAAVEDISKPKSLRAVAEEPLLVIVRETHDYPTYEAYSFPSQE